jgi:hypothetical protein
MGIMLVLLLQPRHAFIAFASPWCPLLHFGVELFSNNIYLFICLFIFFIFYFLIFLIVPFSTK